MLHARLAALSIALSSTLPACGPELNDGNEGGETMEESEGSSGGSSSGGSGESSGGSGESTGGDVDLAGQPCMWDGTEADCMIDGVQGTQYCIGDRWSACVYEPCDTVGESRVCDGGTQHCAEFYGKEETQTLWGLCAKGECELGDSRDCGFGPDMPISMGCQLDQYGVPLWDYEACNTPLVLSFGEAVEFAPAAASAAEFDIHGGAGVCTRADWPSAATPWLALDLDKNGSIDGGHELFGSGTRMSSGTGASNGFVALAELDSDGDGKLSASDARWDELVLWADHDADRRSSGWETLPLSSFEIVEIELAYERRRECDAAGNCGIERARFVYRELGQAKVGEVVDVHLACE